MERYETSEISLYSVATVLNQRERKRHAPKREYYLSAHLIRILIYRATDIMLAFPFLIKFWLQNQLVLWHYRNDRRPNLPYLKPLFRVVKTLKHDSITFLRYDDKTEILSSQTM